jgi:hypothetical protein
VTGLLLAGTLFAGGLLVTFAGSGARGRLLGLTLTAAGATAVLALGAPRQAATWWLVGPAVVTLAAMLALARSLARQLAADDGADQVASPARRGAGPRPGTTGSRRPHG